MSTARAIVVLAEAENADAADAMALRVVLSLSGVREGLAGHIVVEMSDIDNELLVKAGGTRRAALACGRGAEGTNGCPRCAGGIMRCREWQCSALVA